MNTLSRKQEILNTAAQLFKERGYSAVTMRDLATAMGIKAASLYNHINSKQQILTEVVLHIAREFTSGIDKIAQEDVSTIEKLYKLIEQHVVLTSQHPYEMAALNNDWMHLDDGKEEYLQLRSDYENHFRAVLQDGKNNEELSYTDEEVVLFSILSTLRNLYLWIPRKEALNQNDLIFSLSETLLKGVVR